MQLSNGGRPLVEVDFVDAVGAQQRLTLSSCTAVRFEDVRPVRRFRHRSSTHADSSKI
ncbi:hypothetical protein [Nocardia sp. NPDC005998]|uniref:hypothetical protein n=1 Tax=Nocardia sp. NPDC005998 TaxID=3156894 RepID=UPI0033AD92BF